MSSTLLARLVVATPFAVMTVNTLAQAYPSRPLRLLVPFAPGGGNDFLARLLGQKLGERLGQQVVADNRPGAGGNLATDFVAKAAPDCYTLLLGFIGPLAISPNLEKVPYDSVKDFAAVSLLASSYHVLAIHPSLPARSVKQLIALAKAKPGQLNYASGGSGTPLHLVPELFKSATGVNIMHIAYKGSSPAVIAVLSGEAHMLFGSITSSMPHVRTGKLTALAVTNPNRSPLAPEVPTLAESGVRGVEAGSWYALVAPAATPKEIIGRLHKEVLAVAGSADYTQQLQNQAFELLSSSPEDYPQFVQGEIAKWGKVIKSAGIKVN
jgi:tripartite-type tricarboxylate transporter receptor subunit TctC